MKLSVKTNIDEVFRDLDRFVDRVRTVAVPRALNKLRDQAQTAGFKEISNVYQIGPRTMEKYAAVTFATAQDPEASIKVKGRGFPLEVMKPTWGGPKSPGVYVTIKGRRRLIPHSFLIKRFGKHVFARGGYGGKGAGFRGTGEALGRFQYGRGRLPIQELFTFGPVEAFSNPGVVTAMQDRVEEQAQKVIAQEIRFARAA